MILKNIRPSHLAIRKLDPLHAGTPESNLFFAIIAAAINDMEKYKGVRFQYEYRVAKDYLSTEVIPHAELIGLDSEYIRTVMRKVGMRI